MTSNHKRKSELLSPRDRISVRIAKEEKEEDEAPDDGSGSNSMCIATPVGDDVVDEDDEGANGAGDEKSVGGGKKRKKKKRTEEAIALRDVKKLKSRLETGPAIKKTRQKKKEGEEEDAEDAEPVAKEEDTVRGGAYEEPEGTEEEEAKSGGGGGGGASARAVDQKRWDGEWEAANKEAEKKKQASEPTRAAARAAIQADILAQKLDALNNDGEELVDDADEAVPTPKHKYYRWLTESGGPGGLTWHIGLPLTPESEVPLAKFAIELQKLEMDRKENGRTHHARYTLTPAPSTVPPAKSKPRSVSEMKEVKAAAKREEGIVARPKEKEDPVVRLLRSRGKGGIRYHHVMDDVIMTAEMVQGFKRLSKPDFYRHLREMTWSRL